MRAIPTIATAKTVQESKGSQARFLHHILCIRFVTDQPTGQIIGGVQVRQDYLLKSREFVLLLQLLLSSSPAGRI